MTARTRNTAFYLGIALLFTHELDAMPNHEWRVIPILNSLSEAAGETVFLIAHVPIFAVVVALIASLDLRTRANARTVASAFLILHAAAHYLFSDNLAYEFSTLVSSSLIYGAALCGITYIVSLRVENKRTGS